MNPTSDPVVLLAQAAVRQAAAGRSPLTWKEYRKAGGAALSTEDAALLEGPSSGVFVTLHRGGRLRGCIGTIEPVRQTLAEEVLANAVAASRHDPRFPPVREAELDEIDISVDCLEAPEPYDGPVDWDVSRYGVVVSGRGRRGLLLPNLDGVDSAEQQVSIAAAKAGLDPGQVEDLALFRVRRRV